MSALWDYFMTLYHCGVRGITPPRPPEALDWEALAELADRQAVTPVIFSALRKLDSVPAQLRQNMRLETLELSLQNRRRQEAALDVLQQLRAAGLTAAVLKGMSVARYFAAPETRICADKGLGLQVVLQFTADRDNVAELESIYALSKSLGLQLRYTVAEQSFRRCTPEMLEEFAPEQEMLYDAARAIHLDRSGLTQEAYNAQADEPVQFAKVPVVEKGMPCGAGRNSFCINYRGEMLPCVVFDAVSVKTDGRPLADCWKELVRGCDEIPRLVECANCIHRMHCRSCIAQHYNACKQFGVPAPRLCWKQKYPKRAAEIQKFYDEHGYSRRKDVEI